MADFKVTCDGNLYLLLPLTDRASNWIDEHIPEDATRWCGAVVCEHRYISDILTDVAEDGMTFGN